MWLSQDTCSFECVLRHLRVTDILTLSRVNRETCAWVRAACQECRILPVIENRDLFTVTDPCIFPKLRGFSRFALVATMCRRQTDRLMLHWPEWDTCIVSTRTHTRRAFGLLLLRVKSVRRICLEFTRTSAPWLESHIKGPLHSLVRRNPELESLHVVEILLPSLIRPFRGSRISHIMLDGWVTAPHEICSIVSYMPLTVESFVFIGRVSQELSGHYLPIFLLNLLYKPVLKIIVCTRIMRACSVTCDAWGVLCTFCENTRVNCLVLDTLRVDHVSQLARRGFVKQLHCAVTGCKAGQFKDWSSRLPPGYCVYESQD